jgi:MoaA/NifB/PqqE/SkfB family radical SAM enzyme
MNSASFTSASILPIKVITNSEIVREVTNHNIVPYHIQINPTNKCSANCSFCSCKNRDKTIELSFTDAMQITNKFIDLGMCAVTITGGGDPLCWKPLEKYITELRRGLIKIGLVTNGKLFKKENDSFIRDLVWCRVSISDESDIEDIISKVEQLLRCDIDWAFSYVVTQNFDVLKLKRVIEFANEYKFTHVRIVNDIVGISNDIANVKNALKEYEVDLSKCVFQGRKEYTEGSHKCLISLLKPNIDPYGRVQPCCGIQYAFGDDYKDFPASTAMGEIEDIWKNQKCFIGSNCKKCYYSDYNVILNTLWDNSTVEHKDFV